MIGLRVDCLIRVEDGGEWTHWLAGHTFSLSLLCVWDEENESVKVVEKWRMENLCFVLLTEKGTLGDCDVAMATLMPSSTTHLA